MKFETKILLSFSFMLVLGFSAINLYVVYLFKSELDSSLYKEIKLLLVLYSAGIKSKLPDYVRISEEPLKLPDFSLRTYSDDKFVYVRSSYLDKKLKSIMFSLLFWEFTITISVLLLTYFVLSRFYREQKERENFLNLSLIAITHKLGNFISAQKVNIGILEAKYSQTAIKRLKVQVEKLEEDFKKLITMLESVKRGERLEQREVSISKVVERVLDTYEHIYGRPSKLLVKVHNLALRVNPEYLDNLISILVENAFKYSRTFIHIRTFVERNRLCLVVRNDIKESFEGSGIGLKVAGYIADRIKGRILTRNRGNVYTTVLRLKL